jgi:subtilisin family serine protease
VFRTRRARRSVLAGVAIAAVAASLAIAGIGDASAASNPGHVKPKVLGAGAKGAIPDSYIVVLKNSAVKASAVSTSASTLTKRYGGKVTRTYKSGLRGFAAHMSAAQAQKLAANPDVKYVEQNHWASKSDTTQLNVPSWGLDRLDQIFAPLNKRYTYPNTASNVHAYVLDTGIRISHSEFGGRASYGYDFVDNDAVADDCEGHGTHVSGTIGGTNYGVAKQVQLVGVRVLDCNGEGTADQLIAGIDWVTANAVKPAVANMSLGFGDVVKAVDDAVNASINSGVTYSVAAGNDADDACNYSPASVPNAITVGASDELDFITSFSNTGKCVDINAPGNAIPSAWNTNDTATNTISGTSMASPHVAGAAAIALSANPTWSPAQVRNFLVYGGTRRVVRNTLDTKTTDVILKVAGPNTPQVTGLRSLTNGKNITTGTGGVQPIKAATPLTTMGDMEKFTTLSVGDGYYTFASWVNGKFITATNNGAGSLIANGSSAGDAQKFKPITNSDGTVTLQAKINGKYVTAPSNGAAALVANATTIGTAQKFIWASPSAIMVLRSRANKKIVTTPSAGAGALIASIAGTTQGGNAEQFDMIDLGGQLVTFRAHSNKKFVTAASASSNLIANATSTGATQKFYYYHYGDGSVLFQSANSGYVVQAASNGAKPLIANFDPNDDLTPATLFDYVPIKVG